MILQKKKKCPTPGIKAIKLKNTIIFHKLEEQKCD